jgi:hypothetical protein
MKPFTRWRLETSDLKGLDAAKARDLVIECFFDAQKETLARAKKSLGQEAEAAEMKRATASIVRVVFKEIGADFDHPTKETLTQVVQILSQKAEMWGTPADIIAAHTQQIGTMLRLL